MRIDNFDNARIRICYLLIAICRRAKNTHENSARKCILTQPARNCQELFCVGADMCV